MVVVVVVVEGGRRVAIVWSGRINFRDLFFVVYPLLAISSFQCDPKAHRFFVMRTSYTHTPGLARAPLRPHAASEARRNSGKWQWLYSILLIKIS